MYIPLEEVAKIYHESAMAANVVIDIKDATTGTDIGLLRIPDASAKIGDTRITFGDDLLTFDFSDDRCDKALVGLEGRRLTSGHSVKELFHRHLEAVRDGRSLKNIASLPKSNFVPVVQKGDVQPKATTNSFSSSCTPIDAAKNPASCFQNRNFRIEFESGICSGQEFLEGLQVRIDIKDECADSDAETEIKAMTGKANLAEAIEFVDALCREQFEYMERSGPGMDIKLRNDIENLEAFFDGHGDANWQRQTVDANGKTKYVLEKDFAGINSMYNGRAQNGVITFPDDLKNFKDCALRAVQCCFVKDRQANDNNGNCDTPYDEKCVDADPGDNTDLCYVDMADAPKSAQVAGGYAIFPDDIEGDVHCQGFAWGNDGLSDDRYKGNNLFYVGLYDHFYTRGYVGNVPGAPSCGCVEQMPVVSRSDCTEMTVTEKVRYTWRDQCLSVMIHDVDIEFNACQGANNKNNDLEAYYERLVDEGRADEEELEKLQTKLVGDCDSVIDELVNSLRV